MLVGPACPRSARGVPPPEYTERGGAAQPRSAADDAFLRLLLDERRRQGKLPGAEPEEG